MGAFDELKDLANKAQQVVDEHQDQIKKALDQAEKIADDKTGGKYRDQLAKAGIKADELIDKRSKR